MKNFVICTFQRILVHQSDQGVLCRRNTYYRWGGSKMHTQVYSNTWRE